MDNNKKDDDANIHQEKMDAKNNEHHSEKIRHFTKKKLLLVIVAVIFLTAGIGYGVYVIQKNEKKPTVNSSKAVDHTVKIVGSVPKTGASFLSNPTKMSDLGLIKNTIPLFGLANSCYSSPTFGPIPGCNTPRPLSITYSQIGTNSKNQPYILATVVDTTNGDNYTADRFLFVKTAENNYTFYQNFYKKQSSGNNSSYSNGEEKNIADTFAANVTINKSDDLTDFTFPQTVTIAGATFNLPAYGNFTGVGNFTDSPVPPANSTKLGSIENINFYRVVQADANGYQVVAILAYIGNYQIQYEPYDTMVGGNSYIVFDTWTSGGEVKTSNLVTKEQGCGKASGFLIYKNPSLSNLTKIGVGPSGQTVYQLINGDPLLNFIYANDYSNGQFVQDTTLQGLSLQQFQDKHAVMLVKNSLGDYQIYLRADMVSPGQCGKPVIYLYPTQTQSVDVKVDATITKSIPTYETNGWKNVTAHPNGMLTYQNDVYPNLFWEGIGNGLYPTVKSGTIVKTSEAAMTIKKQLQQQGLNNTEVTDFLAYWVPKLPNTPYTRLTWFNTEQMNRLAPLTITPTPTTLIRVFLDFQGLQKPYSLPTQVLTAPSRNGFTAIEWGGLLR